MTMSHQTQVTHANIDACLRDAFQKRQPLLAITDSLRLVNGIGDDLPGLVIDQIGSLAVIFVYQKEWLREMQAIQKVLKEEKYCTGFVLKDRSTTSSSAAVDVIKETRLLAPSSQEISSIIVQEYGLKFKVDVREGLNCGLFLDMRANRHRLGTMCRDKKVLNCFSYTCAFGVHARANGAREVVNVDLSKNYLKRGEENYALNHLPVGRGKFLRFDAMKFLLNCVKKDNSFDVIILDPPSFARQGRKVFQVKRDMPKLIALAVAALRPQGILFVSTNCSELSCADLERMLAKGLNGKKIAGLERVGQDVDFTGTNQTKESYMVGLIVHFI